MTATLGEEKRTSPSPENWQLWRSPRVSYLVSSNPCPKEQGFVGAEENSLGSFLSLSLALLYNKEHISRNKSPYAYPEKERILYTMTFAAGKTCLRSSD